MNGDTGQIFAVCISDKKGVPKENIRESEFIYNFGLKADAHAGNWNRQVSILSKERIDEFISHYGKVEYGAFGENLVISEIKLDKLTVGSFLVSNDVMLQVTQFGKECHSDCTISKKLGKCIMPVYGVFARVIRGGKISVGDLIRVEDCYTAAVITLSDRAANHEREDMSGPLIENYLAAAGFFVQEKVLLEDDKGLLKRKLIRLADDLKIDLIITTGGTGCSMRDTTPEATIEVGDRMVPGIAEYIRYLSIQKTAKAILSRGVSVLRGKTLIVNLPGSPKAVTEVLPDILATLKHGIGIVNGKKLDE